jgi:hypothetical protein
VLLLLLGFSEPRSAAVCVWDQEGRDVTRAPVPPSSVVPAGRPNWPSILMEGRSG